MSQSDNFDIFDLDVQDMNFQEKEEKKKILYSPKYADGKDNIYKAIVRFIPNPTDPKNKSMLHKYVYWLNEQSVNVRGYFDSPQTIGEKCPLASTYWKLAKSESAVDQQNAKKLNRKEQFHSLVHIIKDPNNPDLEGQTLIFRYNKTIKALIDEQAKPDEMTDEDPINVFDLFKGKDFYIQISKKGEFPDYSGCKFSPKVSAITVDGEQVERTKEGMELIKQKVLSAAPDLAEYDYKPLTQEQESQVFTFISSITEDTSHLGSIMGGEATTSTPAKKSKPSVEDTVSDIESKSDASEEDDDFDLTESVSSPESKEETSDASSDDDLESFLNDI